MLQISFISNVRRATTLLRNYKGKNSSNQENSYNCRHRNSHNLPPKFCEKAKVRQFLTKRIPSFSRAVRECSDQLLNTLMKNSFTVFSLQKKILPHKTFSPPKYYCTHLPKMLAQQKHVNDFITQPLMCIAKRQKKRL